MWHIFRTGKDTAGLRKHCVLHASEFTNNGVKLVAADIGDAVFDQDFYLGKEQRKKLLDEQQASTGGLWVGAQCCDGHTRQFRCTVGWFTETMPAFLSLVCPISDAHPLQLTLGLLFFGPCYCTLQAPDFLCQSQDHHCLVCSLWSFTTVTLTNFENSSLWFACSEYICVCFDPLCYFWLLQVQAWEFEQYEHEAVFIAAGTPHQVRNLRSCIKVGNPRVSPLAQW